MNEPRTTFEGTEAPFEAVLASASMHRTAMDMNLDPFTQTDAILSLLLATVFSATGNPEPEGNLPGDSPEDRLAFCLARLDVLRVHQWGEPGSAERAAIERRVHG